jgi:hypothetical protein
MHRVAALALGLWMSSACAAPIAPMTVDDGAAMADASRPEGYPEGPYGRDVGAVIAPFTLAGFVNDTQTDVSTAGAFGPYSLAALQRSGRAIALVHTSGFL